MERLPLKSILLFCKTIAWEFLKRIVGCRPDVSNPSTEERYYCILFVLNLSVYLFISKNLKAKIIKIKFIRTSKIDTSSIRIKEKVN